MQWAHMVHDAYDMIFQLCIYCFKPQYIMNKYNVRQIKLWGIRCVFATMNKNIIDFDVMETL